ncbi:MAG: archaetidylserine decarboxylase [Gammaproteobacteria bacterium]
MQDATLWERIKGWLFHVFPHHLTSRITFRLTRLDTPLKRPLIRLFIRAFKVDMSEAAEPDPARYASFNAFFTRALKPGARPLADGAQTIASPADGRVSQLGDINDGRVFQAKGQDFTVLELLGGSTQRVAPFLNGTFCTIYLSPRDYHRVHMPVDGRLREMMHAPGRLFSVSPYATRVIPRLFARNERVAAIFDTPCGPMAIVMVGAVNVSAIETVWAGLVTPPAGKRVRSIDYSRDSGVWLRRGEEMGRFNMGSTAILLFGEGCATWNAGLRVNDPVKMGQRIGRGALATHGRSDQAVSQENAIA